jgi:hypothetical protein
VALIEARLAALAAAHRRAAGPFGGVRSAAGSIRDLLEDWNGRPVDEADRRRSA